MPDLISPLNALGLLTEASWKGIPFPTSQLRLSLSQDLAEFRYWQVDGARFEGTGMAPIVYNMTIPFRNNLASGRSEGWRSGQLYPDAWQRFLSACSDRRPGTLVHPAIGPVFCYLKTADTEWDPNKRDGVDVTAQWIQSIDDSVQPIVPAVQAQAGMTMAAIDLDNAIFALTPRPTNPIYKPNFADTIRSILAVGDHISLARKQYAGQIDGVIYRAKAIEASIIGATAGTLTAIALYPSAPATTGRALLWPIVTSCERLRSACYDQQRKLLASSRDMSAYVVPQRTTVAMLVVSIGGGTTLSDLMKLNPTLAGKAIVEAKTLVHYYTPKRIQ